VGKRELIVEICTTLQWYESIRLSIWTRGKRNRTLTMKFLMKLNQIGYSKASLQWISIH